jgi:hypothetical protein
VGGQSGSAQAIANYGQLSVASSVSSASATPELFFSSAFANAFDGITINAPGLTGSQGLLNVYYTLDGTISASGPVSAFVQVTFDATTPEGNGFSTSTSTAYTSSTSGLFETSSPLPFTFGTPFSFGMCLGANSGVGIAPAILPNAGHFTTDLCAGGYASPEAGTGVGAVNFLDTLSISSLQVTDSFGNPVNDATLVAASGTQYPFAPEPGPGLMAVLGFGMIAAYWKLALKRK